MGQQGAHFFFFLLKNFFERLGTGGQSLDLLQGSPLFGFLDGPNGSFGVQVFPARIPAFDLFFGVGGPVGLDPEFRGGLVPFVENVGLGWKAEGEEVDGARGAQDLRKQLDLIHSLEERETLVLLRRLRHPHEIDYKS